MANYHGPLKAVDCHLYSVRYDMVVSCWLGFCFFVLYGLKYNV